MEQPRTDPDLLFQNTHSSRRSFADAPRGAEICRCVRAMKENEWMTRLSDVKETEQLLMEEGDQQEKQA